MSGLVRRQAANRPAKPILDAGRQLGKTPGIGGSKRTVPEKSS